MFIVSMVNAQQSLLAVAGACSVNGYDVTSSFAEIGLGLYSFWFVVQDANATSGARLLTQSQSLAFSFVLQDSGGRQSSAITQALLNTTMTLVVDSVRPTVSIACSPPLNASVKAAMSTVCVQCSDAGSSCAGVMYSVNGGLPTAIAVNASSVVSFEVGPFVSGVSPSVTVWAFDAAGNAACRLRSAGQLT
jgi:hypothetical protein